jgi:hypothetical protein
MLPGISVKKTWNKEEREITALSKKTVETLNEERRNKGRDEKNVCVGLHVCLCVSLSPCIYPSFRLSFLQFTDLGYLSIPFCLAERERESERERERERIVVAGHALYTYSGDLGSSLRWDT